MDTFMSILSNLSKDTEVYAKFTIADPKFSRSVPTDLKRRKENQQELLDHLEGKAFKLPQESLDRLKTYIDKPGHSVPNDKRTEAGGNWVLSDISFLKSLLKGKKKDDKLASVISFTSVVTVKDEFITVGQFIAVLDKCVEDFKNRVNTLQTILHISDDDLSVKNLKRYLKNVDNDIENISNIYSVHDHGHEVDLNSIRPITHNELNFIDEDDIPDSVSDLVRALMQLTSGGEVDEDGHMHNVRHNAPNNAKEGLTLMKAFKKLFPSVHYEVIIDRDDPMVCATEIARINESYVKVLDSLTGHAWESKFTIATIRAMKQIVMLVIHGGEDELVSKAKPIFMNYKAKLIDERQEALERGIENNGHRRGPI
jgi:hypothetical protein